MRTEQDEVALREEIVTCVRELSNAGLVIGTAGNVSARLGSRMLITPSGKPYDQMESGDICLLDEHGGAVEPDGAPEPSSETPLHLAAYAATDARAVVHFHGLYSTAVATTAQSLPVIHYYAVRLGGEIRVAPYSTFGSSQLASDVAAAIRDRKAALMANHGGVAVGATLSEAYANAELLEWLCQLHTLAFSIGDPRRLTSTDISAVQHRYSARG